MSQTHTLPRAPVVAPAALLVVSLLALGLGRLDLQHLFAAPQSAQALAPPPATADPDSDQPPPRQPVYTDQARAVLDNLAPADDLAGWEVVTIDGVLDDRTIHIQLTRDDISFTAVVAPRGSQPHRPPAQTDDYDLFYTGVSRPDAESQIATVLAQLAQRVKKP